MTFTALLFWICIFIVFYTYIGYGLLLGLLVRLKEIRKNTKQNLELSDELPEVTLFITAYNESGVVEEKMENTGQIDYPKEKLQVLWVTDGSTDDTVEKLQHYEGIRILHRPERMGKTAAINRGMEVVNTPITVFTDANTRINREAIQEMVRLLNDPQIGCVAGEKRIQKQKEGAAVEEEGLYWRYESTLKALDARLYSAVGAAGELFAIRTSLFEKMPIDTLLDDFILSMHIAMQGYRIAYCQKAYATETASKDIQEEKKRKVRISAGGLQSVIRLKALLNPFRYGWLSFQYVSHRVLRWTITPIALVSLIPLNYWLIWKQTEPNLLYLSIGAGQILFYLLVIWGWINANKTTQHRILFVPYYFFFMNTSIFKGFSYFWKKKGKPAVWEKVERF